MDAARALQREGLWLAVAESCTGGLLGAHITDEPGASSYFRGGVVAYSDEVKKRVLGVPVELLDTHGAVSAECARAMAMGVLEVLSADVALAVTGVAGPGGGSPEKPVGLVYIALARRGGEGRIQELRLAGTRSQVRSQAASEALALLEEGLVRFGRGDG